MKRFGVVVLIGAWVLLVGAESRRIVYGGDVRVRSVINSAAVVNQVVAMPTTGTDPDPDGVGRHSEVVYWVSSTVTSLPDTINALTCVLPILNADGTTNTVTVAQTFVQGEAPTGGMATLFFNFGPYGVRASRRTPTVVFGILRHPGDVVNTMASGVAAGQWSVAVGYRPETGNQSID